MPQFLRLLLAILLAALLSGSLFGGYAASAAADDDPNVPPTVELNLMPAPEPRPALKFRLLPTIGERTPGNAATHYYRAIIMQRQKPKEYWQESSDNYTAWNESPRAEYPKEQVAKWLEQQKAVLAEIKQAAYKEHCDWDFRLQDVRGPELYSFLLPEIQECRELARTLRVKARYEIFDGRPDDAFETLRWGYQLARDASQPPLLVSGLVGVAIAGVMNYELEHLIEESGDNYYWAIAGMPQPLVDLQPALAFEMNSPFQVFPFLRDAETAVRSPDEWRRLIISSLRDLSDLGAGGASGIRGWQGELAAAGLMAKLYPVAKETLIAAGMQRDKVEAMSVGQVVAIHTARATEAAYHDIFKFTLLPYDQAMQRLPGMLKTLEKDVIRPDAALSGKIGLPIANLILPAVLPVLQAEVRASRSLAILQVIEAIRMHAATSGGKLPATLAEITLVPVPNNPATGQPFPYKLDAASGTATLDVPAIEGQQPRHTGKHYILRVRAK
jgi:hypothetical protein